MEKNIFEEKYSSKIDSLYIPLSEFKFHHGASSEEIVDDKFIGREKITDRLKSWLTSETPETGVYLVTGFRGVGKSSFVGKVLYDIAKKNTKYGTRTLKIIMLLFGIFVTICLPLCLHKNFTSIEEKVLYGAVVTIGLVLIIIFLCFISKLIIIFLRRRKHFIERFKKKTSKKENCVFKIFYGVLKVFYLILYWLSLLVTKISKKEKRIVIKLNLGHEILNERDILSLISNAIEYEYKRYISNWLINRKYVICKYPTILILTLFFSLSFHDVFTDFYANNYFNTGEPSERVVENIVIGNNSNSNNGINTMVVGNFLNKKNVFFIVTESFKSAIPYPYYGRVFIIITSILFYFITWLLWKLARIIYMKNRPNSSVAIYNRLHDLNLRIVSATNEDTSPTGAYSPSFFGLTVNRRKNRNYPLADVREIEQRLSWILDEIADRGKNAPKFIIVFDELDKIDPASNHNIDEKTDSIPAFENTGSGFTGGATTRKHKQNLLKLLANRKYFQQCHLCE